ncbi:hypothetical protein ACFLU6_10005 [Acidobacteriota bacterium]
MPFEIAILDTEPLPLYQRIAAKATHLQELRISFACIARKLGVDEKTVAKAVRWYRRILSEEAD